MPKLQFTPQSLKRPVVILAALALAAGMVAGRERPAVELVEHAAPRTAQPVDADLDISFLEKRESEAPRADPFARKTFSIGRPRATAKAAAPVAPPLPFRYIGKLVEDGRLEVILLRGADHVTVAQAGPLDAEYRVDEVNEKRIAFTYLPLNASHVLELE
jgi:hypothetical protein